jgi:hypothetical protein
MWLILSNITAENPFGFFFFPFSPACAKNSSFIELTKYVPENRFEEF